MTEIEKLRREMQAAQRRIGIHKMGTSQRAAAQRNWQRARDRWVEAVRANVAANKKAKDA